MTRIDAAQWRDMMGYLREQHGTICRHWFDDLEPLKLDGGVLHIQTPTDVQQNYLQRKCMEPFVDSARQAFNRLLGVQFISENQVEAERKAATTASKGVPASTSKISVPTPTPEHLLREFDDDQMVLSPDYCFDNFISGPNNRLAFAASVAVAEQPGTAYNPLFIHGGVGLGKTHLLQAICQKIFEQHPDYHILYVSCDAFMNQFIECVRAGKMSEFRHRYRHVEMLVIDDIHFLANKDRSQEEFFHTFNELYQNNKQIVLSSDAAPNEIPQLEERLVSRFNWGLVAPVTKPSYETRIAILKAKAQLRGVDVATDVIEDLAKRIETNARELEGAITNLQGRAMIEKRPIDLDLVRQVYGETTSSKTSQVTLQNIIDAVTGFYNVKLQDLQSRRRHKSVTEPRQVCMWLARQNTRFSLEEIGGYFGGRDHTTVMHSIKIVEERCSKNPQYHAQVHQLNDQIQANHVTA